METEIATYLFIDQGQILAAVNIDNDRPAETARRLRDEHWPGSVVALIIGGESFAAQVTDWEALDRDRYASLTRPN